MINIFYPNMNFALYFYVKMKIREISNDLDFNEYYPGHDSE